MPTYRCKIAVHGGHIQEKTIIADSKAALQAQLESEGNYPLEIRKTGGGSLPLFKLSGRRRRFTQKDFFSFNQEFSVLIRAGLPIVNALDAILEKDDHNELYEILREIRESVAAGESLSGAFDKYRHLFSNLYVATLRAGEKSGNIPATLSRYIDYLKKTAEIRKKVVSASVYPVILTLVSVSVLFFLMIYVVPAISGTFFETGTQLPFITSVLIQISTAIRSQALYLLLIIAIGIVGFVFLRRTPGFRMQLDRLKVMLPYFGDLYRQYVASKLTRTLATILSAGIPLLEAVRVSSKIINNQYLLVRLERVAQMLEEGGGFAQSLEDQGGLPKLAIRMIAAGESAGSLPEVLNDVADFYDGDVDTRLSVITSAIEPALMVLMGLLIGFIVLALYLPIFQLAGTIG